MTASYPIDYYITFSNHHEGLRLLKAMREAGVNCAVSPTPRAASSCCGMSLRVTTENLPAAEQVITACGVHIERVVPLARPDGNWNKTC